MIGRQSRLFIYAIAMQMISYPIKTQLWLTIALLTRAQPILHWLCHCQEELMQPVSFQAFWMHYPGSAH